MATFLRLLHRYILPIPTPVVPSTALLAENNSPLLTEVGDFIVTS